MPSHNLLLKVGDICFIMGTIARFDGLVNNSRVRIISISRYKIEVQTIEEKPRKYFLPRIRYKFRVSFGQSFEILRTQFPLKLAYACTYNKSQSQTLEKVVLDIRSALFAHGFLYVGMTRIRIASNMVFYCRKDQVYCEEENGLVDVIRVNNIVYLDVINEVLKNFI